MLEINIFSCFPRIGSLYSIPKAFIISTIIHNSLKLVDLLTSLFLPSSFIIIFSSFCMINESSLSFQFSVKWNRISVIDFHSQKCCWENNEIDLRTKSVDESRDFSLQLFLNIILFRAKGIKIKVPHGKCHHENYSSVEQRDISLMSMDELKHVQFFMLEWYNKNNWNCTDNFLRHLIQVIEHDIEALISPGYRYFMQDICRC